MERKSSLGTTEGRDRGEEKISRCDVCLTIGGVAEVAGWTGLEPATITKYRSRGIFPPPDWITKRQDLWSYKTIRAWMERRQG